METLLSGYFVCGWSKKAASDKFIHWPELIRLRTVNYIFTTVIDFVYSRKQYITHAFY